MSIYILSYHSYWNLFLGELYILKSISETTYRGKDKGHYQLLNQSLICFALK